MPPSSVILARFGISVNFYCRSPENGLFSRQSFRFQRRAGRSGFNAAPVGDRRNADAGRPYLMLLLCCCGPQKISGGRHEGTGWKIRRMRKERPPVRIFSVRYDFRVCGHYRRRCTLRDKETRPLCSRIIPAFTKAGIFCVTSLR
jgi:hypothetical protein